MARIEQLKNQLKNGRDIQSVVKTMKTFASIHIKGYQKASTALDVYAEEVENGFASLLGADLLLDPVLVRARPGESRQAFIVFGSDQGLVGRFNEQTALMAIDRLRAQKAAPYLLCTMGQRLAQTIEATGGLAIHNLVSTPSSASTALPVLQELFGIIDSWREKSGIGSLTLIYNQMQTAVSCRPVAVDLLPPDPAWFTALRKKERRPAAPPLINVSGEALAAELIRHYIFTGLFRALMESLKCENAVRLAAMQVAEKHVEEYLDELTLAFNQERQNQITEELLDIVAGVEALRDNDDSLAEYQ
jgi:F-type H+-transporting ATPase subunit gamma